MTSVTQPVRPLSLVTDTDTKAGNYFVSNYPPFAFWSDENCGQLVDALDRPPEHDSKLGIYVHIPFCRKRCHFCYFKVYTDKNARAIENYINAVSTELENYSKREFVAGRLPQFIYFGGGTPSYLSAKQLEQLSVALRRHLPWDEVEEVAFECEPGTLTQPKLEAIRELGVTRLSLGVENFNDHILETNNRAHQSKQIYQAFQWARDIGFPQINIDLISGMLEETEENWLENIKTTIELDPDFVTIYQMEIPFNTTIYKEMRESGHLTAPVADWDTKRRWVKYAFQKLEEAGYTITSAYTAVKNPEQTKFVYRDSLWTGADMIALGVSSFGHIQGIHYQNDKHFESYVETVEKGDLPIKRALKITREESMIREFVLQMKTGKVNTQYFRDKFDVDLTQRFADIFSKYRDEEFLEWDDNEIRLNRDALLQVDVMLHEFFLPEHHGDRYT